MPYQDNYRREFSPDQERPPAPELTWPDDGNRDVPCCEGCGNFPYQCECVKLGALAFAGGSVPFAATICVILCGVSF
jgi:hypothetical protein